MQLQNQWVLAVAFEFVAVGQDHVQALQGHLNGLVVLHAQEIHVETDD
jgi:hypothetical protein